MNGWYFDPISALLGAAAALALMGLVYSFREPIMEGWRKAQEVFQRSTGRLTGGVEDRYRQAVVRWAQQAHVLAPIAPLDRLFVPPRLIPPPSPIDPQLMELLPTAHSVSLGHGLRGHRRLMVVGELASGRTVLLAYLALTLAKQEAESLWGLPTTRLPVCVRLTDLEWPSEGGESSRGGREDLGELLKGAIGTVGSPSSAGGVLRRHLQSGTAVVLVDAWDELSGPARDQAAAWLARLTDAFPDNLWLAAVGPRGFAPLAEAGFVPLRLEQDARTQVEALAAYCADLFSLPEEEHPSLQGLIRGWVDALEGGTSSLDVMLRMWLRMDSGHAPRDRNDLYARALERLIDPSEEEKTWLPDAVRAALGSLALTTWQESRAEVTRKEIEEALDAALPPTRDRPARAGHRAFRAITASGGVLRPARAGRYVFSHPLWSAWLVAGQMVALPHSELIGRLDDPSFLPALEFYAGLGRMEPVINAWLSKPDDLWRTRLRTAARWVPHASPDAAWRNEIMARLARAFLEPILPTSVRDRLARALATTTDPGLPVFLRKAAQHPSEAIRVAAVKAMGWLGGRADLATLADALADPVEAVRAAAASALGHLDTPAAARQLAKVLAEGDETLRVDAARGLARAGSLGWKVLREALRDEDFLTRRAAVYGLGEVGAPWAHESLERIADEDEQWIVRSAASAVLAGEETARPQPIGPPLVVSEMSWLITWAAERGVGVGVGDAAFGPLLRALDEGEAIIRCAAAQALGLAGRSKHADALRRAATDPDPDVARIALWALGELACRHDLTIT